MEDKHPYYLLDEDTIGLAIQDVMGTKQWRQNPNMGYINLTKLLLRQLAHGKKSKAAYKKLQVAFRMADLEQTDRVNLLFQQICSRQHLQTGGKVWQIYTSEDKHYGNTKAACTAALRFCTAYKVNIATGMVLYVEICFQLCALWKKPRMYGRLSFYYDNICAEYELRLRTNIVDVESKALAAIYTNLTKKDVKYEEFPIFVKMVQNHLKTCLSVGLPQNLEDLPASMLIDFRVNFLKSVMDVREITPYHFISAPCLQAYKVFLTDLNTLTNNLNNNNELT